MEIRMFDESCGICRPLQSSQQQSCIVFWTIYPYCWSSLLPTSPPLSLLLITEKVSNIIYKMKKRGQFTKSSSNDVAIYLVYKTKEKRNQNKKWEQNTEEQWRTQLLLAVFPIPSLLTLFLVVKFCQKMMFLPRTRPNILFIPLLLVKAEFIAIIKMLRNARNVN